MVLKQFIIDADIIWDQVGKTFFENPEAKPGRIMRVQVVNAGIIEDLTGYTLNLGWTSVRDPSKFGLDAFDDVDITKGIFEIEYTSGMLTNVGPLNASLQLVPPGEGRPIESNNFKLTVKNSAINAEAIQSETSFKALENALVEVNSWNARIDEVEQEFKDRADALDGAYPVRLTAAEQSVAAVEAQVDLLNRGLGETMASLALLNSTYPAGDTKDHIVAGNIAEVDTLTVTAIPTVAGNITVTLNGVAKTITVDPAVQTTTALVAALIRGTAFTGWTTAGTGTTVTFTSTTAGARTVPIFSGGTTGVTASIVVTIKGENANFHRYFWNGTVWADGGAYQAIETLDDTITPSKTTFLKLNTAKNMFGGNYIKQYLGGNSGALQLQDLPGNVARFSILPNTSYSIAYSLDIPTYMKIATSTKILNNGEFVDGAINANVGESAKSTLITTGPNDKYLYVSVSLVGGPTPKLKVLPSTTVVNILPDEPYPLEPQGISVYNKDEVDAKVKNIKPLDTTFFSQVKGNLFDGNFIFDKYLGGNPPTLRFEAGSSSLIAITVKPNTLYTILKDYTAIEAGYYYFKVATSKLPLDTLKSRSLPYTMDGSYQHSKTSDSTSRYTFTTGPEDVSLLVVVAKALVPYVEIIEGSVDVFQYTEYGQARYEPVGVEIYSKNEVDSLLSTMQPDKLRIRKTNTNEFTIYYPSSGSRLIGYTFGLDVNATINLNSWRLKDIGVYSTGLGKVYSITEGDNEGVLKIDGEADYVGSVHGDEITVDKYLYLDGIQVDIDAIELDGIYNTIEFLVGSDIYNADLPTKAFEKIKSITFSNTGVHVKSRWKALAPCTIYHVRGTLISILKNAVDGSLIETFTDNKVNLLPADVPDVITPGTMPTHAELSEVSLIGGKVTAKIWAINRGGLEANKIGSITDFGHRLKVYIDSYRNQAVSAGEYIYDEHKFMVTSI